MSIRDQIPDPVSDPSLDGPAFKLSSLLRWINDAGRIICASANVLQDWYAIPSITGQSTYNVPSYIMSVEQAVYDLKPLGRVAEIDDIFTSKITAPSWWFGPHRIHANPQLHVWPACSRSANVTTLVSPVGLTDLSIQVASIATGTNGFQAFGFLTIDNELIHYETLNSTTNVISNLTRGAGGTAVAGHVLGATVQENNIQFKCFRLPVPITGPNDIFELPQALWPIVELYVLAKVRSAESNEEIAIKLRGEFLGIVEKFAQKGQIKGQRQGGQVRTIPPGPELYFGRTYVP
jgi:hypothetical protein